MNNVEDMTIAELHNMLKTVERGMEQKSKDMLVVTDETYGKNKSKLRGRRGKGKKNKTSKLVFKANKYRNRFACYKCDKKGHQQRPYPNGLAKKDNENTAKTSGYCITKIVVSHFVTYVTRI